MAKKFETYWYEKDRAVAEAHLYHCRDRDLRPGSGIARGTIIQGAIGFAVAEKDVPNLTGSTISSFRSNRQCEWMGFVLPCMAHPQAPTGTATKNELRPFNCIVAALSESAVVEAVAHDVPVVAHEDGSKLANLQVSVFEKQGTGNPRRAKLLPTSRA